MTTFRLIVLTAVVAASIGFGAASLRTPATADAQSAHASKTIRTSSPDVVSQLRRSNTTLDSMSRRLDSIDTRLNTVEGHLSRNGRGAGDLLDLICRELKQLNGGSGTVCF